MELFSCGRSNLKRFMICSLIVASLLFSGCSGDATSDGNIECTPEQYGFIVMNQNGEVTPNATVTLGDASQVTGDTGTVAFDRPKQATIALTVTCQDYYDKVIPEYTLKGGSSDTIVIQSKSLDAHRLSRAVYINPDALFKGNINLLEKYKRVNKSTENLDFDIETETLGDKDTVSKYELRQKTDSGDKLIATSQDGAFRDLKVKDFEVGTGIYVTVYDQNQHQTSTALNLEIGEDPNFKEFPELSIGDGVKFSVPDNIPIFGGSEFNVALPKIPLDYVVSGDKVHIGFNVDDDTFNDEEQRKAYKEMMSELRRTKATAKDYKNLVNWLKERQAQRGLMSMSGFDSDGIEMNVGGYAEAGFDNEGNLSEGTGFIFVTVSAEAEFDWQLVVCLVPVTVNVEGKIEAQLADTITYSFNDNTLKGDAALTIKPGLTVKAGPGFKYLSAGVKGNAELAVKIILASLTEKPGVESVDLTSSIGLYAKIAMFEPDIDLLSGTINLWTRNNTKIAQLAENGETDIDGVLYNNGEMTDINGVLYNLDYYAPIMEADNATMQIMSADDYETLSSGIGQGAAPVSASNGNTALTVFSSQVKLDASQNTYSKLYYSYYNDGRWKTGEMLSKEICNEMNPSVYCDGKDYYLLYQDADMSMAAFDDYTSKTALEKRELMKQMFKSIDLHVQKFDAETCKFVDLGCIETPGVYDYNADIMMHNGNLFVYSAANSQGDFFGTDTNGKNEIYSSCYQNGQWSISKMQEDLNAITYLSAGQFGGRNACVYSVDADNNLATTEDVVTCLYDTKAVKIKDGGVTQIIGSANSQGKFFIANEDGLYALDDFGKLSPVITEGNHYMSEYAISENAIYEAQKTEEATEIYARYLLEDGSYSKPVQVTDRNNWQSDLSVVTVGGKDKVIALSGTYVNDEIHTDLVAYEMDSYFDLSVENAAVSYKDTLQAGAIPVNVTLKNRGNQMIPDEKVEIRDADGNELEIVESEYGIALAPGEERDIQLYVITDENTKFGDWNVETVIAGETDFEERNDRNNAFELSTGRSDFVVTAQVNDAGSYPFIMLEVKNEGNIGDSADVALYDANDLTQEIHRVSVGYLEAGNTEIFKIRLQEEWANEDGKIAVLARTENSNADIYTYNDYAYLYATTNYGTYKIEYELNGGENSDENPVSYTTADKIALKDPVKDGYKFIGWYTSENFDVVTQMSEIQTGTAGDIKLYAKWSSKTGDIDNSSRVDLQDAQMALQAALKIVDLDAQQIVAGDVDKDGKVTLQDAQLILQAALKIIDLDG